MAKTDTLSIRLSPEMRIQLDYLAKTTRRSRSFLGSEAVARFLKTEAEIVEGIKQGIADSEAGRTVSHDEAMQSMRAAIKEGARRSKPT